MQRNSANCWAELQRRVSGSAQADCIGVSLVDGHEWWAPAAKILRLVSAAAGLAGTRRSTPRAARAFWDTAQWYDLLERRKLSVYDVTYGFAAREPQSVVAPVPNQVLVELLVSVLFAPCWAFGMRRPLSSTILATDASTGFGMGVCGAEVSAEKAAELSRLAVKAGDYVRLDDIDVDEADPARIGARFYTGISERAFRATLSVRLSREHINAMEGRAFIAALKWLLRKGDFLDTRVVFLVDSKVWLGSFAKGRSSSRMLSPLLRKASGLVLASVLTAHHVFVPSKHNPADEPSRGCVFRRKRVHLSDAEVQPSHWDEAWRWAMDHLGDFNSDAELEAFLRVASS